MDAIIDKKEEKNIRSILSIDFDFIMSPCINLYNSYCYGNQNPSIIWENIKHEIGDIEQHLKYDAASLLLLDKIIKRSGIINIIKINSHDDLIREIIENQEEDNSNVLYKVYNIDFHHDILYDKEDCSKLRYFNEKKCSNWVGYLYYKGLLKEYHWYKANNSQLPDLNMIKEASEELFNKIFIHPYRDLKNELAQSIFDEEFKPDYLAVALSPQWVPYQYYHLYDMITTR